MNIASPVKVLNLIKGKQMGICASAAAVDIPVDTTESILMKETPPPAALEVPITCLEYSIDELFHTAMILCVECQQTMPHITIRKCTCHSRECSNFKKNSTCTIFRKISGVEI
jgi:hypothetical protein